MDNNIRFLGKGILNRVYNRAYWNSVDKMIEDWLAELKEKRN